MLGTYYYHEIIRKTIVSFGTVFNDISIKHKDSSGDDHNEIKVPLDNSVLLFDNFTLF